MRLLIPMCVLYTDEHNGAHFDSVASDRRFFLILEQAQNFIDWMDTYLSTKTLEELTRSFADGQLDVGCRMVPIPMADQ